MRLAVFAIAVPFAFLAVPAQAQSQYLEQDGAVQQSSAAIFNGSYADAEHALKGELRVHPSRPELLLNLAAVYSQTGRSKEARALYERVLALADVPLDLHDQRTVGSHAIAQTGIRRLDNLERAGRTVATSN